MNYYINGHFATGDAWSDATTADDLGDSMRRIRDNSAAGRWETITDAETGKTYVENICTDDYDASTDFDLKISADCPKDLIYALDEIYG